MVNFVRNALLGTLIATTGYGMPTSEIDAKFLRTVLVHGHRGSRGTHPENTLPAFEEAVRAGAQVLELDLQLTKDDVPVVSHDPDLNPHHCQYLDGKPLKAPIPIRSLKATELEGFQCGALRNDRFPEQKLMKGVKIPTLDAFLSWKKKTAPKLDMNIETKMTHTDPKWIPDPHLFASRVIDVLKKHNEVGKTILQSFDFRTLKAAKRIDPVLRLSCLFEEDPNFCDATAEVGAQWASPALKLVTRSEVERCHSKKILVVPWTANQESEWQALLTAGVDAIITDYPRNLVTYLANLRASN